VLSLIFLAFLFEVIDSGLGMMYGTLLSPILLVMGYPVLEVVPSILLSQAIGGFVGSISHHNNGNSNLTDVREDLGLVLIVVVTGLIASFLGVTFASKLPTMGIKIYIGSLAIIMGLLCLVKWSYTFSKKKITAIGILASFNKSSTGGGFGPLCSTGLIVGGVESKASIAITTLAEVPICIVSFILYAFQNKLPDSNFLTSLCVGSMIGGYFGPRLTANIENNVLKKIVGILAVISGSVVLYKVLV
jgi:uncharacterized membrane protein YfcA